jgi:hypothetical protein
MKIKIHEKIFNFLEKVEYISIKHFGRTLCGPATEDDIIRIAFRLKVQLPDEYKEYMKRFGAISFWSTEIHGHNSNPRQTLVTREINDVKHSLIQVEDCGDGSFYFIDTAQNNQIVFWDAHCKDELIVEYNSFSEFLINKLLWEMEEEKLPKPLIDECKALCEEFKK